MCKRSRDQEAVCAAALQCKAASQKNMSKLVGQDLQEYYNHMKRFKLIMFAMI